MPTIGLPDSIPTKYTGPEVNLVPIRFFPHEPELINKKFPVGQFVILSKDPTSGSEGDLWYLSKFSAGNPVWLPLTGGGSGPTISLSDTAGTMVFADGSGNIQLRSSTLSIVSDPVNNRIDFEFAGGGQAIESFIVPSGTSPVVPDASGQITITAGPGISIIGGLNQYQIGLTGGGVSVDSFGVQATSGSGTDPVVPDGSGNIDLEGALVPAGTNPLRSVSTAASTIQFQVQTSQALSSADSTKVGLCNFDDSDFDVDANGFVKAINNSPSIGVKNLGVSYSSSTFSMTAQDGSSLSSSNLAYVTMPSKAVPGTSITVTVSANQSFLDDSGASTINGNLFGFGASDTTTSNDIPFFIYAVLNDAENAISFMISRTPGMGTSPSSANIGKTGSAVADVSFAFFALDNPTVTEYDSNPCLMIGSFRMRLTTAGGDWTVQSLSFTDGIGQFQDGIVFTMPRAVLSASSNTHWRPNGGTAPVFTSASMIYTLDRTGRINMNYNGATVSTNGVGTVEARLILPLPLNNSSAGCGGGGRLGISPSVADVLIAFPNTSGFSQFAYSNAVSGAAATLLNQDIVSGTVNDVNVQLIYNVATS